MQMWRQTESKRMEYWRDYGAPPNLPRTRNTTIYMPDEEAELLTDFQADFIPPVDQMTEINLQHVEREYDEFMRGKGDAYHKMRDKFGDHQGYCWICSEHPKYVRGMNRYFLVKHNHTSTLVDRIHAPMDKYGQYRCRECAPLDRLEKHYAKQGERKLVCVSSSTLNNWIKRSAANKNFDGTYLHVDWECHAGGTVLSMKHATRAVYGLSENPVDVVVAGVGINDLSRGKSVKAIMSDLLKFKQMVLAIAPRHRSGPSTFAVCTPVHPPAYTRYGWDKHTPQKDLSDEFCSLTNQIMIFNLQSDQQNQQTQHPPQLHRFGVHMHNSKEDKATRRERVFSTTMGEGQVGRPANHRYKDWREYIRSEKVHLNDNKRVSMATAVVSYFRDLHHDGINHLTPPNHNKKVCRVCVRIQKRN